MDSFTPVPGAVIDFQVIAHEKRGTGSAANSLKHGLPPLHLADSNSVAAGAATEGRATAHEYFGLLYLLCLQSQYHGHRSSPPFNFISNSKHEPKPLSWWTGSNTCPCALKGARRCCLAAV